MLVRGLRSFQYSSLHLQLIQRNSLNLFSAPRLWSSSCRQPSLLAGPRPALHSVHRHSRFLCNNVAQSKESMGNKATKSASFKSAQQQGSISAPPPLPQRDPSALPGLAPLPNLKTLTYADGKVCTANGLPILEGVTSQAWVSNGSDAEHLVLGVKSPGGAVSLADFELGILRCNRWLACARNKMWWMTPEWGVSGRELPPETQFLLLELADGSYAILLPLIDNDTFRGTIRPPRNSADNGSSGNGSDTMYLRMESGDEAVLGERWPHALLLACGDDPFALIEAAVPEAARYSGTAKPLREKRLPPSIDKFAWCSWDAFYSSVSAQGLMEGVRSLSAGGAPPKMVIIDDGWQSTDLDARFKGWQDPRAAIIANARERLRSLGGSVDGNEEDFERAVKEIARELYIEGESEMISAVLRDVPAGSATGQLLQEIKAADDVSFEAIDYQTMAQQHDAAGCGSESAEALALRSYGNRRSGNVITRASLAVIQYVAGLIMGAFQAVFILFYQWVVDPAADGTWPVKFFTYLVTGPLRNPMLQFYADQTNFTRRLVDIRANSKFHGPEATPESVHSGKEEDLASVVAHLRSEMKVEFIYCWHGLSAYWSGVCPDSPAMRKYRPRVVFARPPRSLREIEPSMMWNPSVLGGLGAVYDPTSLFKDMHSYLAAAGVNGVKVDCQAGVGMVGSVTGGGPAVAARYHAALEDSVAEHFPANDAINCMCHSTENIYRWRDTAVARASDDFFPTDTASHMPHVAACAFNGLFLSALALPDFDMFQSKHAVAPLHAAARAVSGGPVYVSDAPGHHNFEILHQLVLPDGSVLRANLPGRPTRDCLFLDVLRDEKSLLKIWNVNNTTGVVGVFNLQGSSWDRSRRRFNFHNTAPPRLSAKVNVADVEMFRINSTASAADSNSNGGRDASVRHDGATEKEQEATTMTQEKRASTPSSVSEGTHWNQQLHNGSGSNGNGAAADNGYESDISSGPESVHNGASTFPHSHQTRPHQPAANGEIAAFVNTTGKLHRLASDGGVDIELDGSHAAIVTFARIYSDFGVEFAPLGLKNMMNTGGAITSSTVEPDRGSLGAAAAAADSFADLGLTVDYDGNVVGGGTRDGDSSAVPPVVPRFHIGVRGRGTFIALCSQEPEACSVDGYAVRFSWDKEDSRLEIEVPQVGKHSEQKLVVQFRK